MKGDLSYSTLRDQQLPDHESWGFACPKCGSGTSYIYEPKSKYPGEVYCRECQLAWTLKISKDGSYTLTSRKRQRDKGKRTYEIVIDHASMFISAESNEQARKIALKKVKKLFGCFISVRYRGDHAECNEGIC